MFVSNAWAQAAAPAGGVSVMANIFQILLIFLVFYWLLIRPQQKKLKQHEAELKALKIGDEVITGGGVYGTVRYMKDDDVTLEIAKNTEVKVYRYTIREVLKNKALQNKALQKEEVVDKKSKTKGKKNV